MTWSIQWQDSELVRGAAACQRCLSQMLLFCSVALQAEIGQKKIFLFVTPYKKNNFLWLFHG